MNGCTEGLGPCDTEKKAQTCGSGRNSHDMPPELLPFRFFGRKVAAEMETMQRNRGDIAAALLANKYKGLHLWRIAELVDGVLVLGPVALDADSQFQEDLSADEPLDLLARLGADLLRYTGQA